MPDHLDLEDLLKIPYVDPDQGFDISPDGSQMVFSWNQTGRWEIYILNLKHDSPPQIITAGKSAKFAPHWSPDGQLLAYTIDLDGGENCDIYIYHPDSGLKLAHLS